MLNIDGSLYSPDVVMWVVSLIHENTVEVRKLEYDCCPTPKPREERQPP